METNGGSKFSILFFKTKIGIFDFKKSLEVTVELSWRYRNI
jgi:hypothetical protein